MKLAAVVPSPPISLIILPGDPVEAVYPDPPSSNEKLIIPSCCNTAVTTPFPSRPVDADINVSSSPGAYCAPLETTDIVLIPASITGSNPTPPTLALILIGSLSRKLPLILDSVICIKSRPPRNLRTTFSQKASAELSIP